MRFAYLGLYVMLVGGQLAADPILMTSPLTLTAHVVTDEYLHTLQVTVPTSSGPVCVQDLIHQGPDPLADYRGRVRVAGPYLFLPSTCGGCNAGAGYGFQAFKVTPTVLSLGYLAGGRKQPYEGGHLLALETTLEVNALTSHAAGTVLELVLNEKDGVLSVDKVATWARNRRKFLAARTVKPLVLDAKGALTPQQQWDQPAGTLLRAAALCRYLGRRPEEASVLARAKTVLPRQAYGLLCSELDKLKPLALDLSPFDPCQDPRPAHD